MATPSASAILLLALAALVLVALSFSTSEACDDVPSMSIDGACDKACSSVTPAQVQLCQSTLQDAGAAPTAEITVYALAAAKAAKSSYDYSTAIVDRLLQNPSLPPGEKAAYVLCKDRYENAIQYMIGITNQLSLCAFEHARQEYFDSTVTMTSCRNSLTNFQSSPLYAANAADLNKTFVAYDLGGLIVGK